MVDIPKNRIPKPAMICPAYFVLFFLLRETMNAPIQMKIGIYCAILNDKIRLVTVVPMVAPMMTPTAWDSVIRPELTKLMTIMSVFILQRLLVS